MCLIPGLADGRFLTDESILTPELATSAGCTCHHPGHDAGVSRRGLLTGSLKLAGGLAAAGALGGALLPRAAQAQAQEVAGGGAALPTGDAIIPLGVNGGPVISAAHAQPSIALVVNGTTYLVDAGADATQQLSRAGLRFNQLAHVFITHHHSDHVAGYPALAILGWVQNPAFRRLDVWGPAPMKRMHGALMDLFAVDIPSRVYQGSTPLKEVLHAHQVTLGPSAIKPVFADGNVSVSAVRVQHGPDIADAYAYRFDIARDGTSVVFSGDTAPTDNLVALAQDADVLVHEVLSLQGVEILMKVIDPAIAPSLRKHLLESHTSAADLPAVAKRANVKRLVLSHYAPNTLPIEAIAAEVRAAAATVGYSGEIIMGTELSAIPLQA
jgi:ribonuclease BN (tRNA processing enzyme)